jgi:hypothetical protein
MLNARRKSAACAAHRWNVTRGPTWKTTVAGRAQRTPSIVTLQDLDVCFE